MSDIFESEEQFVVRCYCCGTWVRKVATEIVKTGLRGDEEVWCIGCIRDVDSQTLMLEQPELQNPGPINLEE